VSLLDGARAISFRIEPGVTSIQFHAISYLTDIKLGLHKMDPLKKKSKSNCVIFTQNTFFSIIG
jgi:hypothetical protein